MKLQSKIFAHLRGHGVILEALGAPKPSDRAMSSRDMIAETQRSIIMKAQQNWTINCIDLRD